MVSSHDTLHTIRISYLNGFLLTPVAEPRGLFCRRFHLLPLDLVHEVEVRLIEVVDADVTVLSARGVRRAGRVHGDGVERTEVAADTADLVLEDLVVEAGLEFTLARGGRGDLHGGLTTAEDDVVLLGGDGGSVERGVGGVGFEDREVAGGHELRVRVLCERAVSAGHAI